MDIDRDTERACEIQEVPCLQSGARRCFGCMNGHSCSFIGLRRLSAQNSKGKAKPTGFNRLENQHLGNDAEKHGGPEVCMTTDEAKRVAKHLLGPVCETLQKDAVFLEANLKKLDIDEESDLLAHTETEARDICSRCDCEIFNGHWVCVKCGKKQCPNCDVISFGEELCGRSKNNKHEVQLAVVHSGASHSRRYIQEAVDIAQKFEIETLAPFETGKGWAPPLTIEKLQADFPGCEVKVPNGKFVKMTDSDVNILLFEHLMRTGRPFVVEISIGNMNENFWTAPKVAECFGPKVRSNVRVMATRLMEEMPIQDFFNSLSQLGDDRKATKLGDYPATKDLNLRKTVPKILSEFCKTMPFKRHLLPTGPMNTISALHWKDMADIEPKLFCGHGALTRNDPTILHTDLGDAANLCVFGSDVTEEEMNELQKVVDYDITTTNFAGEERKPAALWHIFARDAYGDLSKYLKKKEGAKDHDPIQQRTSYLDHDDLMTLKNQDIEPVTILQRVGETVVVPGCLCHQVVNVSNTMKIAVDFLSPFNALEFQKNIERIRKEREREDYMGIWRTMHTALTRALNILHGAEEIELDRKNLKEELERVTAERRAEQTEKEELRTTKEDLEKERRRDEVEKAGMRRTNEELERVLRADEKEKEEIKRTKEELERELAKVRAEKEELAFELKAQRRQIQYLVSERSQDKHEMEGTAEGKAKATATVSSPSGITQSVTAESSKGGAASVKIIPIKPEIDSAEEFDTQSGATGGVRKIVKKRPKRPLREDENTPKDDSIPTCSQCRKKQFPSWEELEAHHVEKHYVKCPICRKLFTRKSGLDKHLYEMHNKKKGG